MSDRSLPIAEPLRALSAVEFLRGLRALRGSVVLLLFLLFFCGCAGYQIGNQSLYPQEVHTVYVPVFKSTSFRRNLGERLTEAVVKEIEATTPYKVVADPNADTVLSGSIVQEGKTVLVPSLTGDAREVQAVINVQVSWTDRKGILMRPDKNIPLPAELADVTGTGDVVAEVGQSVATAQQEAICRIAKQIVGLMEKPW
jgi:Lipopolysaccharide-assembly